MAPINDSAHNPLEHMSEAAILIVKPHVVQAGHDHEIARFLERNGFMILGHRRFAVTDSIARFLCGAVGFYSPPEREIASLIGMAGVIEVMKENAGKDLFSLVGPADGSKIGTIRHMYGINQFNNAGFCTKTKAQHNDMLEIVATWEQVFAHAMRDYQGDVLLEAEKAAKKILDEFTEGKADDKETTSPVPDGADNSEQPISRAPQGNGMETGDSQLSD